MGSAHLLSLLRSVKFPTLTSIDCLSLLAGHQWPWRYLQDSTCGLRLRRPEEITNRSRKQSRLVSIGHLGHLRCQPLFAKFARSELHHNVIPRCSVLHIDPRRSPNTWRCRARTHHPGSHTEKNFPCYLSSRTNMSFSDFSKVETIKSLNEFLTEKSYVDGYVFQSLLVDQEVL